MVDRRQIAAFALLFLASCADATPLPRSLHPQPYRAGYEVSDHSERPAAQHTEFVDIVPPYGARVVVQAVDGETTGGRVTNREFLWELGANGKSRFGTRRTPGGPTRAVSFAALSDAARAGVIESYGSEPCMWFAYADPAPAPLAPPTEESRVESCVDRANVMHREVWTLDGRLVRETTLEALTFATASDDDLLEGRDPDDGAVSDEGVAELLRSQTIVADDVPTPNLPLDLRPVRGWKHDRRSVVVEAGLGSSRAGQSAVDSYLKGISLVVVELALRAGDKPTWSMAEGTPVDLRIGNGRVVFFADHADLRVTTEDAYARISAPTLAIARSFADALRVR